MYHRPRVIPVLLIKANGLYKTVKFKNPTYLGDPINAIKIFNEKGADELCVLDITATASGSGPNYKLLEQMASEAFMPLSYGGGISGFDEVRQLYRIGFEKIILNTSFYRNPGLVTQASGYAGSQSVVVSIDVNYSFIKHYGCYTANGTKLMNTNPVATAQEAEKLGAGEILLNSIHCDGIMKGYDLKLIEKVSKSVEIPVIACGGAGSVYDMKLALDSGAHAVSAGSMFVYYGKKKAVLINMPSEEELLSGGVYNDIA